jgi:ankyrin repeat protein
MERGRQGDGEQGRVAVKREKEEDERENEEEEEERKRQKVDEQARLNQALLDALLKGNASVVKSLVERGADLFFCTDSGVNALFMACQNQDYEAAEEIVMYLIRKCKILMHASDNRQWSALHYAANYSSAKVCEILIDNGCDVNGTTKKLSTPLIFCCDRIDEEAWKVAKLLIERGADVAKKTESGDTALHIACFKGRDDSVQLLIDAEADVNDLTKDGRNPLILAARNRFFGERMIPILMEAGADIISKSKPHIDAVRRAFGNGGKMLKALAPFVPEGYLGLKNLVPADGCPDPIGAMTEGLLFGFSPRSSAFGRMLGSSGSLSYCWSKLRNGEFDIADVFQALSGSDNVDLWCISATELWQRSAGSNLATGETILHLAVKCTKLSPENKIKVVQHIASFFINPLVLDNDNRKAIDYCTKEEKELHRILANYQNWKPDKKVMDWYGPYCRRRLKAFVLVEKRLQLGFPRDLKNLILSYVAEREYVWVPKKK